MPMNFPDMKSLTSAAEVHHFRKSIDGESEDEYRTALADHVEPLDFVESCEIRNKVGWDKFSDNQNRDLLRRSGLRMRAEK
jgi:hypothetical protein